MTIDLNLFYEEKVSPYYNNIYRYLLKLGCDNYLAEDIAQETLEIAYKSINNLIAIDYLEQWLINVAKNKYISEKRLAFHKYEFLDSNLTVHKLDHIDEDIEFDIDLAKLLATIESHEILDAALAALPKGYENVIRLRFLGELSYSEISALFSINENTARSIVFRGINKLKPLLLKLGYVKEDD